MIQNDKIVIVGRPIHSSKRPGTALEAALELDKDVTNAHFRAIVSVAGSKIHLNFPISELRRLSLTSELSRNASPLPLHMPCHLHRVQKLIRWSNSDYVNVSGENRIRILNQIAVGAWTLLQVMSTNHLYGKDCDLSVYRCGTAVQQECLLRLPSSFAFCKEI